MKPVRIETAILASSLIGAVLLSIAALGFSSTPGEMSKLAYEGNLWCVSNWIEEEDAQGNRVFLPDPDGRGKKDRRLVGKEDWLRMDQVEAQSKEEAEKAATRPGLFEASEKIALRGALDKNDQAFFTSHFNTGATSPGPCMGTGIANGMVGHWINDSIRKDCFDIDEVNSTSSSGDRKAIYNPNAFSAKEIDDYLAKHFPKSPLKGKGAAFVAAGKKYGVNPGFMLGIANAESSLGAQNISGSELVGTNNAFGMGGNGSFKKYSSFEEGIEDATRNASSDKYTSLNKSIREFRLKWCGFETETESSGVKLSDGSSITYACKNGKSDWASEVSAIMDGLIKDNLAAQPTLPTSSAGLAPTSATACGPVSPLVVSGVKMVDKNGKLGREEHLSNITGDHYVGPDSAPLTVAGNGAFSPHTTDQEHWYFTAQWPYADFSSSPPRVLNNSAASAVLKKIRHAKLVIKSVETGKTMVVSAEEAGPAGWVTRRDGINFGGPPEVYRYLAGKNPYTGNPKDNNSRIEVLGFASSSSKLGPCK